MKYIDARPRPAKHPCPDCKMPHNTPAEYSLRAELFEKCAICNESCTDAFIVHDALWREAMLHPRCGIVHLKCLQERIPRPLTIDDFPAEVPLNSTIRFGFLLGADANRDEIDRVRGE